jgi:hypothetical protein
MLEEKGIPPEQVSFFWRPGNYSDERFVGRGFYPVFGGGGRFYVGAFGLPSDSGVWVASRPRYEESEIIGEAAEPEMLSIA